jgi:hypothetical protein
MDYFLDFEDLFVLGIQKELIGSEHLFEDEQLQIILTRLQNRLNYMIKNKKIDYKTYEKKLDKKGDFIPCIIWLCGWNNSEFALIMKEKTEILLKETKSWAKLTDKQKQSGELVSYYEKRVEYAARGIARWLMKCAY